MKNQYYIGDLCYVMHSEWSDVCRITIKGGKCLRGKFALADGRVFAFENTAYGDGSYEDQLGNVYGVDSGSIGVIAVDDISEADMQNIASGHVFEFSVFPFMTSNNGEIEITDGLNHVYIDTLCEDEYDEDAE